MEHIITKETKQGFIYYAHVYKEGGKVFVQWEGLKDNATGFPHNEALVIKREFESLYKKYKFKIE